MIKRNDSKIKEKLILAVAGLLFCIYLGFLCGSAWVEKNSLNEYLDNLVDFVLLQHNFIVGITPATKYFVLVFSGVHLAGSLMALTRYEHPFAGEEYGRAAWGNAKDFSKEFADHDKSNEVLVNGGDVALASPLSVNTANYWIAEDVYISVKNVKTSNLNMLIVGPPGSGKTFRFVKPVLSSMAGSYIVTDPKKELTNDTAQYFEDNGYEVMVLNIESEEAMATSIHFNPFRYIRTESDVISIAGILFHATKNDDGSATGDAFFENAAEDVLISLVYLIVYFYPAEQQNWKTFVELLNSTTVYTKADRSIDNKKGGIMMIEIAANEKWQKDGHTGDFPGYKTIEKYYHGAAETTSSIIATLDSHCRYMKLQCVQDLLSEDEINIAQSFAYGKTSDACPSGKRILYIVTSEDKRYYDWITSMVYALVSDELYHVTGMDPKLRGSLKHHLTYCMDEFANVFLPETFVERLSTMRSRNMSAMMIVQNLIQLKRKFPKYDMDKDLIGNCSVIEVLGAPDMDSCEYLSKHFGTMTIRKASETDAKNYLGSSSKSEDVMQKSLLSPEDIFAMKKDGECAIVIKGSKPLFEPKCQIQKTEFIKLLCRKTPYDSGRSLKNRKNLRRMNGTILTGEAARKEAERLRKNGVKITKMTMEDLAVLHS